ncbi:MULTISPECIES: DUF305 domain-containing protein [Streptomyces]|uniref:DUF305 domain-containing protein n=1 Tax=Streptomyces TaxID=1883 RepID=UPI000B821311|nr:MULTISPECIES: DUF305 domain-containing protein [unclassified Streptomyces]MYQ50994.1 DUF305 domain-containing protein [Streptomyces sp. SID4941]
MSPARVRRTRWLAGSVVGVAVLCAGAAAVATARDDGSAPAAASAPRTPSAGSADAGFAREMAVHHQQAVEMSFVVRDRTKDEDVRRLAYDIANTQANQRGMLLGWLDLWELPKTTPAGQEPMAWMSGHGHHDGHAGGHGGGGHGGGAAGFEAHDGALMPGMATRTELKALGAAEGVKAEVLFLQLMTDHHKGGVTMAEGCAELCAVPAEKRLAQGMVEAQRSELDLMADMLAARGAAPRP